MKQIVITLDSPEMEALEKQGDKEAIAKVQNPKVDIIITLFLGVRNDPLFVFLFCFRLLFLV